MVPLAISALSVLLDKEGSDYIFHSFFEQALMVLTWHLQRTIKSWILFVQKVKDLYTHWLHWIFKNLWHLLAWKLSTLLSQVDCTAKLDKTQ